MLMQSIIEFKNKRYVLGRKWVWTPQEAKGPLTFNYNLIVIFVHKHGFIYVYMVM